jgi:hypothetical protein
MPWSILGDVAAVVFVYYGATRGLNEVQARFVAERLSQRSLFSPPAGQRAVRLRETLATDSGQASEEVDLEHAERDQLLHVLDQADMNKELDHELRDLQMMLRGERWPGEPEPPAPTASGS